MFTGIIEDLGEVTQIIKDKNNIHITVKSNISSELKIDQSLAHNGVCLTVVELVDNTHTVTAIQETLDKTNLNQLAIGDKINLERAMKLGDRLDGHIVQGHVDQIATCTKITDQDGSKVFQFKYTPTGDNMTIEKGSITVNGTSLTVFNSRDDSFEVAIIPYTYENTNFHTLKINDTINLEFDILGKYIIKLNKK